MSSEASFFEMLDLSSPSAKYAVNGLIPLCIPYLSNMVTNPFVLNLCFIHGLHKQHSYGLGILFASTYIGRGFGFRTSAFAFIMAFYLSPLVTYKYYFPSDKYFGFKISTINLKLEFCQEPDNNPYLSPLELNITKVDHRRFRCSIATRHKKPRTISKTSKFSILDI
uniref:N-acetyltransferase domain-containing protein n=1 Tax=Caenorhabditis tropicalis TaxID=1561998 RepID=A0A1I7UP31_9PELO